jgi:hypothetical protein
MNSPVIKVGDILLHISQRITLLNRELENIRLTEETITAKIKEARTKDKKAGISPYVKEAMETRLKVYFLQGRIQELTDMSQDIIQKVGEATVNGSN